MSELAHAVVATSLAFDREMQRRENAKKYHSLVLDNKHPVSLLMRPARYKILYGGRGAVKSWGCAEAAVRYVDAPVGTYIDRPERFLCTREFQNSIKDSVHQLLCDTIDRMGLNHRFSITEKAIRNPNTGGAFLFKGLHANVQEIKSTEGITKTWIEEAQSTTDESWRTVIPTVRLEGVNKGKPWTSEIWATFNVTDEEAPSYKRFVNEEFRPKSAVVQKLNWDQNPFFPQVLRDEMEYLRKADYEAYLHVWEGLPLKLSDAIIFGKKVRVEGFPDSLQEKANQRRILFGADFGFARDPSTLIRFFIVDRTLYVSHEAYGVGVELGDEMKQFWDSVPGSRTWPIKCDSARPETISHMRSQGFQCTAAEKWKGCVEDGIAHMKGYDAIVIHDRCKHVQQEARLYAYKKDKITDEVLPIVVDKHNHCWDAIRYGLDGYIQRGGNLGTWAKLGGKKANG